MKRPMKKKMVGHSTFRSAVSTTFELPPARSSIKKPPVKAMREDSICVMECVKKPRMTSTKTKRQR